MFDSGVTAKKLIDAVKEELDIALPIDDSHWYEWLSALEQLLYSEIIHEQRKAAFDYQGFGKTGLLEPQDDSEAQIRFEDIFAVYKTMKGYDMQLIKSTLASYRLFPNSYCKAEPLIAVNVPIILGDDLSTGNIWIYYYVRPKIKNSENGNDLNIAVPFEFLDMLRAKLRGEACKLAGEDAMAAKWLNDYNTQIEAFKQYIQTRQKELGM